MIIVIFPHNMAHGFPCLFFFGIDAYVPVNSYGHVEMIIRIALSLACLYQRVYP